MDNEQPHQELVKCVVVGDTAVGKTRLVWARAGNKQFSLAELLNTHVPTVWAIDQYRVCKEVLERSWVVVDGVNVSLRLWDTFGDHDKDRRFAYGRSDVVLLCFSVASPVSLRNCRVIWYPEIRRFCPNTPILLVGCKNDLRHVCKDEQYMRYCRERSPLVRPIRECDLVLPSEGRAVAREMGIEYYETSVLSYYGVPEVFDNVVRAALVARRHQRFWMTNLKRVQRPMVQAPFRPPKPSPATPDLVPSSLGMDLHCLYRCSAFTDLVLVAGSTVLHAHRFLVAAASTAFQKLLLTELCTNTRRSSDASTVSGTFGDTTMGNFNSDTECLISSDQSKHSTVSNCVANCRLRDVLLKRRRNCSVLSTTLQTDPQRPGLQKTLNHPAFLSISIEQWEYREDEILPEEKISDALGITDHEINLDIVTTDLDISSSDLVCDNSNDFEVPVCGSDVSGAVIGDIGEFGLGTGSGGIDNNFCLPETARQSSSSNVVQVQTVVTLSKLVTGPALSQALHFMYTGTIFCRDCRLPYAELTDLRQAAEFLELSELQLYADSLLNRRPPPDQFLNGEMERQYLQMLSGRLREVCLDGPFFSDVLFELEDGAASGHRPLLMARCDMMHAMFSGDFMESNAKVVTFPGVKQRTFRILLQFLYTDTIPTLKLRECLPTIELANRLCLPRLITLVEFEIIDLMQRIQQAGGDVSEDCLHLLEPLQLHNACQLVEWCLINLATSYNHICQKHPKLLRNLHPENQAWLNRHRWPPVWYLKDFDYYERCVMDRQREANPLKPLKRSRNTAGCLCFTSKARRSGNGTSTGGNKQSYRTM